MKKAIHFGAGNIGRGFIGALLNEASYEVTFADLNQTVIEQLNTQKQYKVVTAEPTPQESLIKPVAGLNSGSQITEVEDLIGEATFLTTAIGAGILPLIAPAIAKAITKRVQHSREPLYVIACENQISATDILRDAILAAVDAETKVKIKEYVHFCNSAVDRIVPAQPEGLGLDVMVEAYYEWVVESKTALPEITGMTVVPDLAPFIERKLFTVNTGHAVTAYLGYAKGYATIDQTLEDKAIYEQVEATLGETGGYLIKRYGLDATEHAAYIKKIIHRFENPLLADGVDRVGRSPLRKLGAADRLVRPAVEAGKLGLPHENLAKAIVAALKFDDASDDEAVKLQKMLKEEGLDYVLTTVCGLTQTDALYKEVVSFY
ncbi:mannitol-1-phosphate 5-dehydrogenase [Brochothrix thermosphacta]|uniref:mannitol-1-phosphate 5-dehydrogenase n=1 Tax=Brochothrix thermosphacta TaxID=2756 RepID=UPI00083FD789|nr:mannitol-1-phosphate 5-dehydrogenase [Brochothrix thermosphacta]ODJ56698.1 mannitol-1-phosphate 5-dehydrogenase [Brochothrix thermosphacta]